MLYPGSVVPLAMFFGHVMSSHHSEQMSQRSQVSRMAPRRGSQNVFVFVFVFVNFFGPLKNFQKSEDFPKSEIFLNILKTLPEAQRTQGIASQLE